MKTFVSLSERGKPVIIVDSVKFTKHRELKTGEICWRCSDRSCKAKVYTVGSENKILRSEMEHIHKKKLIKLNGQIISASGRQKAIDGISEKPSKIIRSAVKENTGQLNTMTIR